MKFDKDIKLITNNLEQTYDLIKKLLLKCRSFKFNVAFITWGGYQILAQTFNKIHKDNIKGKILTTSYQRFNDPKIMKIFLENYSNFEMKVVDSSNIINEKLVDKFHPKGYIFEFDDHYKILIGSVNMTESAMKTNVEWSFLVKTKKDDIVTQNVLDEFDYLWKNVKELTNDFIEEYSKAFYQKKTLLSTFENTKINKEIKPNKFQIEALENLKKLRNSNHNKALIIAATGIGKTFLSAFDVKQFQSNKTLFVVHREEILLKSLDTFKKVIDNKSMSIFKGKDKEIKSDIIFASQQTLHRNLDLFKEGEFDYIIIDEAHHATANTYLKIINYFKPKFLLGMTATPERMDGFNVLELFENNIAIDKRLKEAIDSDLITTFHYFGISDIESINITDNDFNNLEILSKKLMINKRVNYIIEQINIYKYDGPKMFCIGFCVNIEHAKYMSEEFNKRSIVADYIVSTMNTNQRQNLINRFQDEKDPLCVLFVVDIFNEGVDIPNINLVLFLRPTNSPIIFLQQLGRGLRKNNSKKFLTVLDFISNYNKSFLIPYAFASFNNIINETHINEMVKKEFKNFSNLHIEFDEISQKYILNSLEKNDFNSRKWLKYEYQEFKKIRNNLIPYYMCDYLVDGAPNILKIIQKYKHYINFILDVEHGNNTIKDIANLIQNDRFNYYLEYFSKLIPIYRANEFAIILECIKNKINHINKEDFKKIIDFYTLKNNNWVVDHTFRTLSLDSSFFSDNDLKKYKYLVFKKTNENTLTFSNDFKQILQNNLMKKYLIDCLEFGLHYFNQHYNLNYFQFPFLKVGEKYKKIDALFINQDELTLGGIGASVGGVQKLNNNFYFFITLIKDEDIKNSLKYEDGIDINSRKIIYWDSPNNSFQSKGTGYEIINHKKLGLNINIFIRKYKKDNYYYLGKANVLDYKGNKPIKFKLELENALKDDIFYELISKK